MKKKTKGQRLGWQPLREAKPIDLMEALSERKFCFSTDFGMTCQYIPMGIFLEGDPLYMQKEIDVFLKRADEKPYKVFCQENGLDPDSAESVTKWGDYVKCK